ncbi:MAG: hypothetical protein ACJZ46_04870 [Candidatus Thalassarchaeaceae archaeon]|jgi:hypothetical protein|tara:strand:- start:166 stop:453 length:288 start_codon:yes stop_codon:yes gene_type:complete
MGFKSNARKRRKATAVSSGKSEVDKKEYVGEIKCDVAGCDNWADKKIGGRKKAYDWAVDVWGDSGLSNESRRVALCKSCYKVGKKHKKDEPDSWS